MRRKKNVKMSAAETRSRAVWASHTQPRALTIELLGLLVQTAKFRIDIDSYYIFKLQLLFTLSRDCHLLSHSNCCFHYRSTVTRLDTLSVSSVRSTHTYTYRKRSNTHRCSKQNKRGFYWVYGRLLSQKSLDLWNSNFSFEIHRHICTA